MPPRLIVRLDIKGPNLIKAVQMEGLRVMGDPCAFAPRYGGGWRMKVVTIDYGMGNLCSVRRAVKVSGATDIEVSTDSARLAHADRVILPGAAPMPKVWQG